VKKREIREEHKICFGTGGKPVHTPTGGKPAGEKKNLYVKEDSGRV
jgi:hypothetical protein